MSGNIEIIRKNLQKPVVLIGLMGVGKSEIGRAVSQALGYVFIESDTRIVEREGCSIPDIFAHKGEPYFRDLECRVIADCFDMQKTPFVLSTGGGAVMSPVNADRIWTDGLSVWLQASAQTLMARVQGDRSRPLLQTQNPEKTISDLLEKRTPVYQRADIHINTDGKTIDQVVDETLSIVADCLLKREHTR